MGYFPLGDRFWNILEFLPTAYGILGEGNVLQACVILFTGESASRMNPPPRMHTPRQKIDGQQAIGTHPTGMHIC